MFNKKMKFILFFFVFLITVFSLPVFSGSNLEENFINIAENKKMILYINEETTEIALKEKKQGKVWYSNPQNRADMEKIARGSTKERLKSQLEISYITPEGREKTMDNYNDSVKFEQYEIVPIEKGVRVDYIIGKEWKDNSYLPRIFTEKMFKEEILAKIDNDSDKDYVRDKFAKVYLEEVDEDYEREKVPFIDQEEVLGDHTLVSPDIEDTYDIMDTFFTHVLNERNDINAYRAIKTRDIDQLLAGKTVYVLKSNLKPWDEDDLIEIIKKIGFTPEQSAETHLENNLDPYRPNIRRFNVSIKYVIEDDELLVEVPKEDIDYPQNVLDENMGRRLVSIPLHSLNLLNFFGAADETEKGYMLVPDGSGALIHLNNEKLYASSYSKRIFSEDPAIEEKEEKKKFTKQIHLPVYGLKKGNRAFMSIIEKGEAVGKIKASIAGKRFSYNRIYPEFILIPRQEVDLRGGVGDERLNIFQPRPVQGDIRLRFSFFHGQKANYVDMAHRYQDYLVQKGLQPLSEERSEIPLFLETVGAIHKERPVMGVSRKVVEPLTNFKQQKNILEELQVQGITNINLKYSGWLKGGLHQDYLTDVNIESKLGEKEDFESLINYINENNIGFYPEISVNNVYKNKLLDGFNLRNDGVTYLDGTPVELRNYNLASYQIKTDFKKYILAPERVKSVLGTFLKDYSNYDIGGISFRHLGEQISSNMSREKDELVDRQQVLELINEEFSSVSKNYQVTVNGGNSYILPHVNNIFDIPLNSTNYNLIDESIPFYQIVLHGYVDYAGEPLNLAENKKENWLKSIESGAYPYFKITFDGSEVLKDSNFDYLYSTGFSDIKSEIINKYEEFSFLNKLQSKKITDHQKLEKNVYKTTFGEQTSVIVNYNKHEVEVNDRIIAGQDYTIVKE